MITPELLDGFLAGVRGQALREGTRYAREARVGDLVGSDESVSTVVRGQSADYETVLWVERERLDHRCSCPSWRDPCKHEVAAALVLKQGLAQPLSPRKEPGPAQASAHERMSAVLPAPPDPGEARRSAVEERLAAARREKLLVRPDRPPYVEVRSPSGFAYRVQLRGQAEGPHSCDCPDFEANRLHTCKHTERVRRFLRAADGRLSAAHREAAARPRIYLHFGEVIEPRLLSRPRGRGAAAVLEAFDHDGIPLSPLARDESKFRSWLDQFGSWVEPEALAWLELRASRRPVLPKSPFEKLLPALPLSPYPFQW